MRESGVQTASPVQAARERRLAEDLEGTPLKDRPLRRRLRNFRPAVDSYIASLGGPLPYMQRLREIERRIERQERELRVAWESLRAACGDDGTFARRWRALAASWRFDEVNDLIERHNRFYPTESRLPMDPRTGDFVLVNGRDYRLTPLDAEWALERFPPE